ncbi:MAG TPA: hypothetical protein VL625_09710 [Patescibacteria group bacterium]|nr:hypothetical protein [Patescibacteria group bacterium]
MVGEELDTSDNTYPDTDPRHPGHHLPRPSALVRGDGSLQSLGLDGGAGGFGNIGQLLQGFMQMIMQLFGMGGMNLAAHDRHQADVTARPQAQEALQNVRDRAKTDPNARQLIDDYNKANAGVKAAVGNAEQKQNATNFLALQSAEMDRSVARTKIIAFDAKANGNDEMAMKADHWRVTAMAAKEKIENMQRLPPEKRDAAMEKFAQEKPDSALSRDWERFKAGDLKKWEMQDTQKVDISAAARGPDKDGAPRTTDSVASHYGTPGSGVRGGDKLDLTNQFTVAVNNTGAGPQQPAPLGPAVVRNNTQTLSA